MQSKSWFDLDHSNSPVVELQISSSLDVRDKIARRFVEELGHASQWCEIHPNGDNKWTLWPIKPSALRLRDQANAMLRLADELERTAPIVKPLESLEN